METIQDKTLMEAEIKKANAAKLMSANKSLIRQGQLREILTNHDYHQWEDFLQGKVDILSDVNEGTCMWLEHFQGYAIKEETPKIDTEMYIRSWNRVREHTSCAPGAMHYGTFKSIKWCRPHWQRPKTQKTFLSPSRHLWRLICPMSLSSC